MGVKIQPVRRYRQDQNTDPEDQRDRIPYFIRIEFHLLSWSRWGILHELPRSCRDQGRGPEAPPLLCLIREFLELVEQGELEHAESDKATQACRGGNIAACRRVVAVRLPRSAGVIGDGQRVGSENVERVDERGELAGTQPEVFLESEVEAVRGLGPPGAGRFYVDTVGRRRDVIGRRPVPGGSTVTVRPQGVPSA